MQNQGLNGAQFLAAFLIMSGALVLMMVIFLIVDWWRHR